MKEARHLSVFWVGGICVVDQTTLPPSWNSVVGTGIQDGPVPPAGKLTGKLLFRKAHSGTMFQACTHTHALVIQGFIWRVTRKLPNKRRRSERETSLAVANTLAYAISEQKTFLDWTSLVLVGWHLCELSEWTT